jgi:hypothetical protein
MMLAARKVPILCDAPPREFFATTKGPALNSDDLSEMGPIDYLLVEWPGRQPKGEVAPHLVDLVERGLIRILDLAFIAKGEDGSVTGIELADLGGDVAELAIFEGASSGLLSDEDVSEAGNALEPGTSAALLVFENTWAAPFASAVRRSGGQLVASGRIPVQAVLAALDAAEASSRRRPTVPGLLRGVARTAVIAGTATSVSNRVSRRQGQRWAQQEAPQQQYAPAPEAAPAAAPAPAGGESSLIDQLKQLGELKSQGILTEEEFAAQKAKLLG